MLWVEGPLTYVEVLCAVSFRDAGHHVRLYHYGDVQNVPEGIELVHGSEILDIDRFIKHGRTGSFALFSDVFRYHMLQQRDRCIWADLDAYCVKPFESETGHFFGWESGHHINGGVLGLPPDSEALGQLLEMTEDEYGIPEWYPAKEQARLQALKDEGRPVHVSEMDWGVWGPHAVTHYLHKTGEAKYALPRECLYPVRFRDRRLLMRTRAVDKIDDIVTEDTYSVHFYGRRVRVFLSDIGGLPEPGSWMDRELQRHGVDCAAAPVPKRAKPAEPAEPVPPAPQPNALTALADKFGSEKGSKKHRYTELYHMLFNPFRRRKITVLELGLLDGGTNQGEGDAVDLPSVRMWLKYFPQARIHGLDVSDCAGFEHERFTFHRCDLEDRAEVARVMDDLRPAPEIVIDDASHASHHQQNAFLEIFPRLPSGALYVIESLRSQPEEAERRGITKTAALFRSWLDERRFSHSDPAVADEFNALAKDIAACIIEPVRYQKGRKDQVAVIQKI